MLMSKAPAVPRTKDPAKAVARMREGEVRTLRDLNAVIASAEPFVMGGTRAVLGEGPLNPALAFVGEQPGDQEDLQGRPFVGRAGQLLTRAFAEAGIDRDACYLTNAVKHFKFEPRGKRRIHAKPNAGEVTACNWWLGNELRFIKPDLAVALGATAAQALLGRAVPVTKERGQILSREDGLKVFVTVHPSYLLRLPDEATKAAERGRFLDDMRKVKGLMGA